MEKIHRGGCACEGIRYEIAGDPVFMVDCQCRQCQRASGTGHQSHLTFVGAKVTIEGELSYWQSVGEAGSVKRRGFCPTCGSSITLTIDGKPDVFIVTPASLDDPSPYKPNLVSWTSAGYGWDYLDPSVPKFEKMPPA